MKNYNVKLKIIFLAIIFFGVLGVAESSEAKTLYVDQNYPSASDSITYAQNDEAHPWATIGRAAWGSTSRASKNTSQAAQAGDIVTVYGGTYAEGVASGDRFTPTLETANAGTAGSRIVFQCNPGDNCIITHTGLYTRVYSTGGPVFGCTGGKGYITWKGFYINAQNAQPKFDTGQVVITAAGCIIDNNTIIGMHSDEYDNDPIVRIEGGSNGIIQNNILRFPTSGDIYKNTTGVQMYGADNVIVQNNVIYNVDIGVFPKGSVSPHTYNYRTRNIIIRYNLIYNGLTDGSAGVRTSYSHDIEIYQNIIYNMQVGYVFAEYSNNVNFYNNTIDDIHDFGAGATGALYNIIGTQSEIYNVNIYNNIVTNSINAFFFGEGTSWDNNAAWYTNYNNYYGNTRFWHWGNYLTFSQWASAVADEANSITTDPQYVNRTARNYKLRVGSPALTAGNTGGPIGAYISGSEIIGLTSESSDITPPASPTGLSVQ